MLAVGPDELLSRLVRYLEDLMQVRGSQSSGLIIFFGNGLPRSLANTQRHPGGDARLHDNMHVLLAGAGVSGQRG